MPEVGIVAGEDAPCCRCWPALGKGESYWGDHHRNKKIISFLIYLFIRTALGHLHLVIIPPEFLMWCLGWLLPTCSCLKAPNPTQTNAAIMLEKSRLISAEQPSSKRETTANLERWISACGTAHWGWRSRLPKDVAE